MLEEESIFDQCHYDFEFLRYISLTVALKKGTLIQHGFQVVRRVQGWVKGEG